MVGGDGRHGGDNGSEQTEENDGSLGGGEGLETHTGVAGSADA